MKYSLVLLTFMFSPICQSDEAINTQVANKLESLISSGEIPGAQYTVVNASGLIFEYSAGRRDIANNLPVTPDTVFMLNSSTKVFTAAAILKLLDHGKISLDQKISQYLPTQPYGPEVTIRHLLSQTSGIPNPLPLKWLHLKKDHESFNEDAVLAEVLTEESTRDFSPGDKYAYSNISYWLLGKIIESVSGLSYCEYLQKSVFAPLDISADQLNCTMPDEQHYAAGYQKKYTFFSLFLSVAGASEFFGETEEGFIRFKNVYHNGPSYGGLFGSGRGVARFLSDLLKDTPQLLRPESRDLFFTIQKNNKGEPLPITLGWRPGKLDGNLYYEKPGGGPGGHSNIRIYPDKKIATIYFINKTDVKESNISGFSNELDRLLFSDLSPKK